MIFRLRANVVMMVEVMMGVMWVVVEVILCLFVMFLLPFHEY